MAVLMLVVTGGDLAKAGGFPGAEIGFVFLLLLLPPDSGINLLGETPIFIVTLAVWWVLIYVLLLIVRWANSRDSGIPDGE